MKIERGSLADYLGDWVTFRNLQPVDGRIDGLPAIRGRLGLVEGQIPRKTEPAFAAAIVHFLNQAQSLRGLENPLTKLLYVGDTQMNDGTAILNLGGHLPIWGFIGAERLAKPRRVSVREEKGWMVANRWAALADFVEYVEKRGFVPGPELAVLVDLDKTALGARGRNDRAIDRARVDAVRRTVAETLGDAFRLELFLPAYDELNRPPYHPFTADNQDYLAYISLMVSAGVYDLGALVGDFHAGQMTEFSQFVAVCDSRLGTGVAAWAALRPIHTEVMSNLRRGDPTPFKSFRYREYETTTALMDGLPDDDLEETGGLAEEILITREVMEAACYWRERGALLFGLSDKPDEASLPRPELAAKGAQPLHRVSMKVWGEGLGL